MASFATNLQMGIWSYPQGLAMKQRDLSWLSTRVEICFFWFGSCHELRGRDENPRIQMLRGEPRHPKQQTMYHFVHSQTWWSKYAGKFWSLVLLGPWTDLPLNQTDMPWLHRLYLHCWWSVTVMFRMELALWLSNLIYGKSLTVVNRWNFVLMQIYFYGPWLP